MRWALTKNELGETLEASVSKMMDRAFREGRVRAVLGELTRPMAQIPKMPLAQPFEQSKVQMNK
jgi:hypothetical protein